MDLIEWAKEKERDARIFQQWVVQLPVMGMTDGFISFSDYKDRVTGANVDTRSLWEILQELDEVEKQFERKEAFDGS